MEKNRKTCDEVYFISPTSPSIDVFPCSSHSSHNSSFYFFHISFYICRFLSSLQTHTCSWIQTFPETQSRAEQLWRSEAISGRSPTIRHLGWVCCRKLNSNLKHQHSTLWSMRAIVAVVVVAVCRNRLALYGLFGLWCLDWTFVISFLSPHTFSHKHMVATWMSCLL